MRKTINILSIISIILAGGALLLAVAFLTVFWEPICMLYIDSRKIAEEGAIVPLVTVIGLIGRFGVSFLLLITSKFKRNIIAVEIISIVLLVVDLPIIMMIADKILQPIYNSYGLETVLRYTVSRNAMIVPNFIMGLSWVLSLVTSGMRISQKLNGRKIHNLY